jgi:hypothetical protein
MKTYLYSTLLIMLLGSCATELEIKTEDVPQAVITAFHAKYPYAKDVEWEVEKVDGRLAYEADFKMEKKKMEAFFKNDGTFIKEK